MPEKKQIITVHGFNADDIMAFACGAFERLNWNLKYATENALDGYTSSSWAKYDQEITIETQNNEISIISKMIHGESFDLLGKNRKHIQEFVLAFDQIKSSATERDIQRWKEKIILLKEETNRQARKETQIAAEVDKVMNFSKGRMHITYAVIAINVFVFIAW